MKLHAKLNLILIIVFVLSLVPTGLILRGLLRSNARNQVIQNARIMMETAMAMRGYTVSQVRPLLADKLEKTFLPQSVPAYSATEIFNALRENHPDYTYKEATLNPTNPRNRAVDWETDIVNEFRRNGEKAEIVGERDTPLGRSLYLSQPLRIKNESCLACHNTPAEAPPSMLAVYGENNGFGWKMNETVGAQIVQVPMSTPIALADAVFRKLMLTLVGVFAVILIVLNLLLNFVVVKPITRLSAMASQVSHGDLNVDEVKMDGKDEVSTLAGSFNLMRISLVQALGMLDDD
ncbi:MAG: HAMP domain-containing protein [Candidatus Krumholzibacteriia bacterium]|jgi:HAMP domain-containing protein